MEDRRANSFFQAAQTNISERAHRVFFNLRKTLVLLPDLVRKPAIIRRWLLGARRAQLALLIVIVTVPTFIPAALDHVLEKAYPPEETSKLFGLVEQIHPDPRLGPRKALARMLLWTGAAGLVLGLLWLQIPRAFEESRQRARELEAEADTLCELSPSHSRLLYRSALGLETEPEREATLFDKLVHVNGRPNIGPAATHGRRTQATSSGADGSEPTGNATILAPQSNQTVLPAATVGHEGRYRLEDQLGRGAMGVVYRALDTRLERPVALKQLLVHRTREPEILRRFRQEAKVLARLSHPHIVQVYDFFENDTGAWIVMELVDGNDLDHRLGGGALPVHEVVHRGAELAAGLGYAHEQGVVHRDFKPANVLIDAYGHCKISDFGIAKLSQSSVDTQAGTVLGSPAYMSPEQAKGDPVDARADIYALGVALYHMATGRLPFCGDAKSVLAQMLTQAPTDPATINPSLPPALADLILKQLAKDPAQRPSSAAEVAATLKAIHPTG